MVEELNNNIDSFENLQTFEFDYQNVFEINIDKLKCLEDVIENYWELNRIKMDDDGVFDNQ